MADESYSFSTARTRLEAIVTQVRKKDTSLEQSLDLLEEGVRLANACTELIDHADWVAAEGAAAVADGTTTEELAPADADSGAVGQAAEESVALDARDAYAEEDAAHDGIEIESDDPADEAWADDLGADDDPSADER
jgi:exodeoxyribonuclease VII small subunit